MKNCSHFTLIGNGSLIRIGMSEHRQGQLADSDSDVRGSQIVNGIDGVGWATAKVVIDVLEISVSQWQEVNGAETGLKEIVKFQPSAPRLWKTSLTREKV